MIWVYIQSEKPCQDNNYHALYTVGFYKPDGSWESESDHNSVPLAAARVHYLNGGSGMIVHTK